MKFDLEYLEKLANIVYENDLSEITLEDDEQAVCLKREKQVAPAVAPIMPAVMPATVTSQVVSAPKAVEAPAAAPSAPKGKPITAPMVGTFYAAPSPDAEPFVEVGKSVSEGDVVCIVEAMKLMNEIKSEHAGKITQVCVKNGDPVEFGQVLMYVE